MPSLTRTLCHVTVRAVCDGFVRVMVTSGSHRPTLPHVIEINIGSYLCKTSGVHAYVRDTHTHTHTRTYAGDVIQFNIGLRVFAVGASACHLHGASSSQIRF